MKVVCYVVLFAAMAGSIKVVAETEDQAISRQLANPVANLIQIPIDISFDRNLGLNDAGNRVIMSMKPVIPFSFSENWNIISRTVMPLISISDITPTSGSEFGLGDTVQSFFLSPRAVGNSGWIWGVGPAFILPTSTNDFTGLGELGAGLTAVALKQQGTSWTFGALVNSLWDIDGDTPIKTSLIQPFISYRTPSGVSYSLNAEATLDDVSDEWSVPVKFSVSKLFRFGKLPVSMGGGIRYWVDTPPEGPKGWSVVLSMSIILPR